MTKGTRIKLLREKIGLSQTDMAKKINVSKQTLYKYENDIITNIPSDKIESIAEIAGSTPEYIMGWKVEPPNNTVTNLSTPAAYPIPILGTICAGRGVLCEDDFQGFFFVDRSIRADFCLNVHGDSMIESHIYDGDKAFIKKDCEYNNGKIYAVRINDETEAVLKRVFWYSDKIVLNSSNPAYEPIVEDPDNVSIIGEYVGVYHPAE